MKTNQKNINKNHIFFKRDYRFYPLCFVISIGIIMGLYIGIIGLIYPNYFEMRSEDAFSKWFFPIFALMGTGLGVWLLRRFLIKRELKLNESGLKYRVGKKIILNTSWKNIKLIQSRIPLNMAVIEVIKKNSNYPYPFEFMHPKERIAAFKKMAEFASKYNIEIQDDLKYLDK